MKAILSDIHSNLEALEAVLHDIESHKVDEIICLGDIIGYGPNPCECLDLAMQWDLVLLGNHDHAVMFEPKDFNPIAAQATFWTRFELENALDRPTVERRWEFLAERSPKHQDGEILYVHGSPSHPLNEYIFPTDIYNKWKMDRLFELTKKVCFMGHTHLPGVFTEDLEFFAPLEIDFSYTVDKGPILCNVGSVGQPRDGDPRACYVLLDDGVIKYRRLEYNIQKTVQKIYTISDLDPFLAERLMLGR